MALPSGIGYKEALNRVRQFYSYKIPHNKSEANFTAKEKERISKDYKTAFGYVDKERQFQPGFASGKQYTIYKSKSKRKLQTVARQLLGESSRRIKAIPVETIAGQRAIPRIDKAGNVIMETKNISRRYFLFRDWNGKGSFETHIVNEMKRIQNNAPAMDFVPLCGKHERRIGPTAGRFLEDELKRLSAYQTAPEWLRGVAGYSFKGQRTRDEYMADRANLLDAQRPAAQRARSKRLRKAGKAKAARQLFTVAQLQKQTGSRSTDKRFLSQLYASMQINRDG